MKRKDERVRHMRKKIFAAMVCAILMVAAVLSLSGCGDADISSYGDTPITISGLTDEEFTVTPNELAQLDCVTRSATGATAKAGTVKAVGPLLNTFLAQYDCEMSDFYKIRFICKDDYKAVLKDGYLTDYEVILAISHGSDTLTEDEQPLRILVPEAESSKWAYGVERIEFEREKAS